MVLDDQGNTVLHLVAKIGHTEAVKYLVKHGVYVGAISKSAPCQYYAPDLICSDNRGKTAYQLAAEKGYRDILKYLLERDENPTVIRKRNV